jgi:glycosyltransferase involved in cell wall biosynthesis
MNVAVVTSSPPNVEGGHMVIARELVEALRQIGHEPHLVVTPDYGFGRQAAAYAATWRTDVSRVNGRPIDRVISLRYPSYAVRHPHHVCWLNHTMREYYDLWPRFSQTLSPLNRMKEGTRRTLIHAADRYLLTRNVTRLFVQSRTIQERLSMWPSLRSEVLYPPAPQRDYRSNAYGPAFLFVSRLNRLKRADLLVRALATDEGAGIPIVLGGDGEERPALERLASDLGVANRVTFAGRLTDAQLIEQLAGCRAVVFPPFQEDYGFVTVEAFAARRAVITCRDSGGPAELVDDGVNGFVCDPTPQSLARALRALHDDEALAARLGEAAHLTGARLNWRDTIVKLVE